MILIHNLHAGGYSNRGTPNPNGIPNRYLKCDSQKFAFQLYRFYISIPYSLETYQQ